MKNNRLFDKARVIAELDRSRDPLTAAQLALRMKWSLDKTRTVLRLLISEGEIVRRQLDVCRSNRVTYELGKEVTVYPPDRESVNWNEGNDR